MKKRFLAIGVVLCAAAVCATGYFFYNPGQNRVLELGDIVGCRLYVRSGPYEYDRGMKTKAITVPVFDPNKQGEIAALCVKAEKHRPFVLGFDKVFDGRRSTHEYRIEFVNETERYIVIMENSMVQFDKDYAFRDEPTVIVKREVADDFYYNEDWAWYCTLSASDYMALLDRVTNARYGHTGTYVSDRVPNPTKPYID